MSKDKDAKASQTTTMKLQYPIETGTGDSKKTISEIEFSRPKGKDVQAIGGSPTMDDLMKVAARCCDYGDNFFDKLDGVDAMRATEVIGDFLNPGQATGSTA